MSRKIIDHYFKADARQVKDLSFWEKNFLRAWFPELPSLIIEQVLDYIEKDQIIDALIEVPRLRDVIYNHYYRKEVHFVIKPTKRPHLCISDPIKKRMVDIFAFTNIIDFLHYIWQAATELVKVVDSGEFETLEVLLVEYEKQFLQAQKLEIHLEKLAITPEQIQSLFRFPNLYKLQTSLVTFSNCSGAFAAEIHRHKNLRELVLLGHDIDDWSNINFCEGLTHLDMSWHEETDLSTVRLPRSLTHLYWNKAGLNDEFLRTFSFPPHISTLMITHNNLVSLNVSSLPQTLKTIDLSCNKLRYFEADASNPHWPPHIKSILLQENHLTDESMKQLSAINWPPFLENLRLDFNDITFEHLNSLPSSITSLDLAHTDISSFKVGHNDDTYPYFKFPLSLVSLNIQECSSMVFETSGNSSNTWEDRIQFPSGLEKLDLSYCNIEYLRAFLFPSSIKTLVLCGNNISDLSSYESHSEPPAPDFAFTEFTSTKVSSAHPYKQTKTVRWTDLSNLKELILTSNKIRSLHHWLPSPSLKELDLEQNSFTNLNPDWNEIFQAKFHKHFDGLRVLNLHLNWFSTLPENLVLPRNLNKLFLGANMLRSFTFTHNIASHENLFELYLDENDITHIDLEEPHKQYSMNLELLDLTRSGKGRIKMSKDTFYGVFEQLGLTAISKKRNLKTMHLFKSRC